jgi:hypothetical protein
MCMHANFLVCGWLLQSASSVRVRTEKTKRDRELIKEIFWAPQARRLLTFTVYCITVESHWLRAGRQSIDFTNPLF